MMDNYYQFIRFILLGDSIGALLTGFMLWRIRNGSALSAVLAFAFIGIGLSRFCDMLAIPIVYNISGPLLYSTWAWTGRVIRFVAVWTPFLYMIGVGRKRTNL